MTVIDLASRRRPPAAGPIPDPDPIPDSVIADYFLAYGFTPARMHEGGYHSLAIAMTALLSSRRPRPRHLRVVGGAP